MNDTRLNLRSENDVVNRLHLRDKKFLQTLCENRDRYFQKRILNTGTKEREICIPHDPLGHFLRKFNAVLRTLPVPPECYGGVPGRSVKDNAIRHINKRFVMNLDIQNFFPSVTADQVFEVLQRYGCYRETSELLTKIVMVDNQLPQGFNTSPLLSIQVLTPIIEELRPLLSEQGATFTVWIDDIAISSDKSPEPLVKRIAEKCRRHGFQLNTEKYHCGKRGVSIQEVTGVVINGDELRPAGGFIKQTENMIHVLGKYGLEDLNAAFDREFLDTFKAKAHIKGRIVWIDEFDSAKADKLRQQLHDLVVPVAFRGVLVLAQ